MIKEKTVTNNKNYWSNVGIEQEQGGYPPLIFGVKGNYFYISARSSSAYFKNKGECPIKDRMLEERRVFRAKKTNTVTMF